MAEIFRAQLQACAQSHTAEDRRIDQLRQLADLHTQGVLTDAEFASEKARILGVG